jgi:hypothetical protein
MTIWNETIPTQLRGRMAGIEQLSYMSGPLWVTPAPDSWPSTSASPLHHLGRPRLRGRRARLHPAAAGVSGAERSGTDVIM